MQMTHSSVQVTAKQTRDKKNPGEPDPKLSSNTETPIDFGGL